MCNTGVRANKKYLLYSSRPEAMIVEWDTEYGDPNVLDSVMETYWDDFQHSMQKYDEMSGKAHYLIEGDLGLWNGRRKVYTVKDTIAQAIGVAADKMDEIDVYDDQYGFVHVTGYHHDGINYFKISKISDRGEKVFRNAGCQPCTRLLRDHNHKAVKFRKTLGWI